VSAAPDLNSLPPLAIKISIVPFPSASKRLSAVSSLMASAAASGRKA